MNEKTKKQAIEILTSNPSPECMALIKQFVWANTATPKYNVGDPVRFIDRSVSIHRDVALPGGGWDHQRCRVGEAVGRVTEIRRVIRDQAFYYTIEYETDLEEGQIMGKKVTSHTTHSMEKDLRPADTYRPIKWSELLRK